MSITISNEDLHTANTRLALRIADLERENTDLAGEAQVAQVIALQFKDEARTQKLRADAVEAAVPALVAEHVRREEALAAQLRKARGETEGLAGVCRRLQDALDKLRTQTRNEAQGVERVHAEQVALVVIEKRAAEEELGELRLLRAVDAARTKRRFLGTSRRDR